MAPEEHQELPHEQDHEIVHRRKSQIPSENQFPNWSLLVKLVDAFKNGEGPGEGSDPVEDIRLDVLLEHEHEHSVSRPMVYDLHVLKWS